MIIHQSYMFASVKERKSASAWVWLPSSLGGRRYDRVGDVTQCELIDHEARLRGQSHEWEELLVVRIIGSISSDCA